MNDNFRRRALRVFPAALGFFASLGAGAADRAWSAPSAAFAHVATAPGTRMAAAGLIWGGPGLLFDAGSRWSLQVEGVAGVWRSEQTGGGHDWIGQIGIEPVLRFALVRRAHTEWFVDAGLGFNAIAPRYRVRDKQFGTVFNFSEHLGAGVRFGGDKEHEVSLRAYHYSNGGIKKPNPGENVFQLRYARWW